MLKVAMWLSLVLAPVSVGALVPVIGESMVALVTPMKPETPNAVDHGALKSLLEWHLECGTKGIVALGTTGEASTLSNDEKVAVLETTMSVVQGKIPVVVGTGTIDTQATIDATMMAKDLGADASLVVTPYYVKPPQRALIKHFRTIADAVDLPMILYNVPGRTGVDMVPETVAELAKHDRIIGIKEATGDVDRVPTLRDLCGENFLLLSGDDATSLEFVLQGGDGVISVTTNICPAEMQVVISSARNREHLDGTLDKILDIDRDRLQPLHNDLFVEANPIPIKWALHRAGRIPSGIRLPLTDLAPEFYSRLENAMAAANVQFQDHLDA